MRRSVTFTLVAAAITVVGWASPATAAPPDGWLQTGHDAGHTYANLGETHLTAAALKAMPAYPGMSHSTVEVGLLDVSGPLIEGDSMFVTSEGWDHESGRLERFDIPTEQRVWLHELTCFSSPVLSSDLLLLEDKCTETAPAPAEVRNTDDASIRYRAADQMGIVHRGVGFFTNYGGGVYLDPWTITAQDLATQDILWTKTSASTQDRMLAVLASGDTLYDEHGTSIEARDAATGKLRWSRTSTVQVTPLAATPGGLYVRWEDGDAHGIARWSSADGRTDWRIPTPETTTPFAFTPKAVYETGPEFVAERSAADGSIVWKTTGYFQSSLGQPVFAGGVLWAEQDGLGGYGGIVAINAANGRFLDSEGAPPGPFTVAEGRLWVGSPDGRVFIYQVPS